MYKLGCYRRVWRCSRSFKVTHFGTNRKPVCEFQVPVNDGHKLASCLALFPSYCAVLVKISLLTGGGGMAYLFDALILDNPWEYHHKSLPNINFFGLYFCRRQIWVSLQLVWRSWLDSNCIQWYKAKWRPSLHRSGSFHVTDVGMHFRLKAIKRMLFKMSCERTLGLYRLRAVKQLSMN